MTAAWLSIATFFSALVGGLFALRFRDRLHHILSFSAGVLLGVVSFDILPAIFELAREQDIDATGAMIALVLGMIFFGQASLRHAVKQFVVHYHTERNHQGLGNRLLRPNSTTALLSGPVLGGMLNYYHSEAA